MHDTKYYQQAIELDYKDELSVYRKRFISGGSDLIYLDGNSLGKLPLEAVKMLERSIKHEWGHRLIRSWNETWYSENLKTGDKIATICGASPGEIAVSDSTSVNLYKLAYAALKFKKGRTRIISDELNFPSDLYILEGLVSEFGDDFELIIVPSADGIGISTSDLEAAIDKNTALVSLSHVTFKSSFMYDMKHITRLVQDSGAIMLWDLSHSVGAVPVELNSSNADMAVGCTYKYLNGGPGSPAFLYVRRDLQDGLLSPIWGWFGEKNPFDFILTYRPGEGIKRFLAGSPPILSLRPIEPTLDMLTQAGMNNIREKSVAQTEFLFRLAQEFLYPLGFAAGSPLNPDERGSHISFRHPEAYRICKALIDPAVGNAVVIPDFRDPDNIRFGITPLYTTFSELYLAVMEIKGIVEKKLYLNYSPDKDQVT